MLHDKTTGLIVTPDKFELEVLPRFLVVQLMLLSTENYCWGWVKKHARGGSKFNAN